MSHLALVADATPQVNPDAPTIRHQRVRENVPAPTPGWRDDALCREVDPEIFFPEKGENSLTAARKVCSQCDVREDCLNYGLVNGGRDGMWGGLSPMELRNERRKYGLPQVPTIQLDDLAASLFAATRRADAAADEAEEAAA